MRVLLRKIIYLFDKKTIQEHKLFLRWAFINICALMFFILMGLSGFFHGVHGPPLVAAAIALIITFLISIYIGKLYWKADTTNDAEVLLHASGRAFFTVAVLQIIGMLGAMFGYREITQATDTTNNSQAIHIATLGLGNGLTATIIGVLCSIFIGLLHFELEHSLTKP